MADSRKIKMFLSSSGFIGLGFFHHEGVKFTNDCKDREIAVHKYLRGVVIWIAPDLANRPIYRPSRFLKPGRSNLQRFERNNIPRRLGLEVTPRSHETLERLICIPTPERGNDKKGRKNFVSFVSSWCIYTVRINSKQRQRFQAFPIMRQAVVGRQC